MKDYLSITFPVLFTVERYYPVYTGSNYFLSGWSYLTKTVVKFWVFIELK